MFKVCADFTLKRGVYRFSDYVIRKHHVTRSIFEDFELQNPKKNSNSIFFTL